MRATVGLDCSGSGDECESGGGSSRTREQKPETIEVLLTCQYLTIFINCEVELMILLVQVVYTLRIYS